MTRIVCLSLLAGVLGLGREVAAGATGGAPGGLAAPAPASPLVARWHWVGAGQLAGDTNASRLRQALSLPSSQGVIDLVRQKLAAYAVGGLAGARSGVSPNLAALLQPLFQDLLRQESYVECCLGAAGKLEWTLAVRLDAPGASRWHTNLATAFVSSHHPPPAEIKGDGWTGWEASHATPAIRFRLAQAGAWTVCAWGQNPAPKHGVWVSRLRAGQAPVLDKAAGWLNAEIDLPALARHIGWSPSVAMPWASLSLTGRGPNLRAEALLTYPQPLVLKLEPWRVPTNTIRQPLTGFSAIQGMEAWLVKLPWMDQLGLRNPPGQMYFWTQTANAFQLLCAWQQPGLAAKMPSIAQALPGFFKTNLPDVRITTVAVQTNIPLLSLQGLPPMVAPFLRPGLAPETNYAVAGLYPTSVKPPPIDPELVRNLRGRTNLLYYGWEVTEPRLQQGQLIKAVYRMVVADYSSPDPSPVRDWMGDTNMSRHLGGSAVTEITLKSPRELTFHRTAPAGFTGFELAALADWIDNPAFPGYVQPEKLRDRSRRLRQQRPPAAPVAPSAAPALPKPPAPTNAPPSKPAAAPRR